MNPLVRIGLFLFFLSPLVFGQTQNNSPRNSSISGRVTASDNPAANIKVSAVEIKGDDGSGGYSVAGLNPTERQGSTATTDAEGRYRITGLTAGKFLVKVESGAFVVDKQRGGNNRTVALDDNEEAKNIDFSVVRGGVITGRVTDSQGRPVIARQVRLQIINEQGQKRDHTAQFGFDMYSTDDRGVYRLYGLPPGRYIVSSGSALWGSTGRKFPTTYHPGVTSEDQAAIIELSGGNEATGVDIVLGNASTGYEALGRVIDSETGNPITQVSLMCFGIGEEGRGGGGYNGNAKTDAQGNFRFAGLPAGRYSLSLSPDIDFLSGGIEYYIDEATFEIANSNAAGIEVRAKRGGSISGIVVADNNTAPALRNKLGQMMLSASVSKKEDQQSSFDLFSGHRTAKIGSDGRFRISGLSPGEVEFGFFSLTGGNPTVARVERDGGEVRGKLEIRPGEAINGVRVVVAYGTGVIRGQVNVDGGKLSEASRIVITANRTGAREGGGSMQAEADNKGRFVIQNLVDGEYELVVQAIGNTLSTPDGVISAPPPQAVNPSATERVRITGGGETQVTIKLNLSR
jgi:protocatechuate 3,4-dioxygenase beta subunit